MIHGNRSNKSSEQIPPGRHSHTSVVFDQGMWIYGGMTDLTERSDLWRLDLGTKRTLRTLSKYDLQLFTYCSNIAVELREM